VARFREALASRGGRGSAGNDADFASGRSQKTGHTLCTLSGAARPAEVKYRNDEGSVLRAIAGMISAESEGAASRPATEIYRTGRALADHAAYPWWADEELYKLLEGNNPHVTVGLAVQPDRFGENSRSQRLAAARGNSHRIRMPRNLKYTCRRTFDGCFGPPRDAAGSGAIAKYLQKFGEGIQQVEYRCANVDRATEILAR